MKPTNHWDIVPINLFILRANFLPMLVIHEIRDLKALIAAQKADGKSIGFVPTMGALHRGHLSLVQEAGRQSDFVVVSIFVNPTQFNDPKDLEKYPRTLQADLELLEHSPCCVVFAPTVETMYPEPDTRRFNFGQLEQVMEGQFRPGHFNGVAQVVSKFLEIVAPDKAFFGQKDFQQLVIVKAMVKQLTLPVEIIACPIIREASGLAMSSRNERLSPEQRENAAVIYKTLREASNNAKNFSVEELKTQVVEKLNANPYLQTEYFEIVNDTDLGSVEQWTEPVNKVACVAVFCGEVRLIDNIVIA
ncbi:pantoate--beta-alanine ligase [Mangrovibacterium lignilyticum]|uniref:pantoate--beta-alanine ligase n=1 Tax=Mangrovibacterium lignilyticum TaxID=2668052 RepID=UPI001EE5C1B6|nr:pantoate--beta-alanine ligase [Mangrovibacterium lignilyticum]